MQKADKYPFYCPQCGEHRLQFTDSEVREKEEQAGTNGSLGQQAAAQITIDQCLKCGFRWELLNNTGSSHDVKLLSLPDHELLTVLRLLYPAFSGLATWAANKTGLSVSMTLKVLQGHRRNPTVERELIAGFRQVLQEKSIGNYV